MRWLWHCAKRVHDAGQHGTRHWELVRVVLGGGDCVVGGGTRGQQCGHEGVLDSETVMDGWAMDGWAMDGWAMNGWNGRRTGRTEKKD